MKFLLKAFLLFTLIVVGKLAKQPLPYVNLVAQKPQSVPASAPNSHSFFVQQVNQKSGDFHQAPGTPPSSSGDDIFTIE